MSVAGDIAPGVRVEVMLAAVDFDDEPVLETEEVDDMSVAWSLAAKMETLFSPGAEMNPQFHLVWGHSFAQTASDFVSHDPHPAAFGGRPPPSGEGLQHSCPRVPSRSPSRP